LSVIDKRTLNKKVCLMLAGAATQRFELERKADAVRQT
jgi:hypothetical protein